MLEEDGSCALSKSVVWHLGGSTIRATCNYQQIEIEPFCALSNDRLMMLALLAIVWDLNSRVL